MKTSQIKIGVAGGVNSGKTHYLSVLIKKALPSIALREGFFIRTKPDGNSLVQLRRSLNADLVEASKSYGEYLYDRKTGGTVQEPRKIVTETFKEQIYSLSNISIVRDTPERNTPAFRSRVYKLKKGSLRVLFQINDMPGEYCGALGEQQTSLEYLGGSDAILYFFSIKGEVTAAAKECFFSALLALEDKRIQLPPTALVATHTDWRDDTRIREEGEARYAVERYVGAEVVKFATTHCKRGLSYFAFSSGCELLYAENLEMELRLKAQQPIWETVMEPFVWVLGEVLGWD